MFNVSLLNGVLIIVAAVTLFAILYFYYPFFERFWAMGKGSRKGARMATLAIKLENKTVSSDGDKPNSPNGAAVQMYKDMWKDIEDRHNETLSTLSNKITQLNKQHETFQK